MMACVIWLGLLRPFVVLESNAKIYTPVIGQPQYNCCLVLLSITRSFRARRKRSSNIELEKFFYYCSNIMYFFALDSRIQMLNRYPLFNTALVALSSQYVKSKFEKSESVTLTIRVLFTDHNLSHHQGYHWVPPVLN